MNTDHALQPLSAQVQPPTRRLLPPGSLLAVAMALVAVGTVSGTALVSHHLAAGQPQQPAVQVIVMNKASPETRLAAPLPASVPDEPAARPASAESTTTRAQANLPRNSEHVLVFEFNGNAYVAIDTVPQARPWDEDVTSAPLPRHGRLQLVGDPDFPSGVVAPLQAADLDPDIAAWKGHRLVIDGRCASQVEDFALIGLVAGAPLEYMDLSENDDKSDLARTILQLSNVVIAGRVQGCSATDGVAQSASLPPALAAMPMNDEQLVRRARDRFLSSELAAQAQRDYEAVEMPGIWWKSEMATVTSRVFRHPATGQITVSIQAVADHGCGGADINLWGLYGLDDSGQLIQRQLIDARNIIDVSTPIDIDGDGTFEFSARNGNGDSLLISFEGEVLRSLEVPFYGCSC